MFWLVFLFNPTAHVDPAGVERDSPRDQLVVTVFLILVFGLLVGAAVKGRMDQANTPINWNVGTRRWWEASHYSDMIEVHSDPKSRHGFRHDKATTLTLKIPAKIHKECGLMDMWICKLRSLRLDDRFTGLIESTRHYGYYEQTASRIYFNLYSLYW